MEEIKKLLDNVDKYIETYALETKLWIRLARDTGGRVSEILRAKVKDVSLVRQEITLVNLKQKKDENKIKTIPLTLGTVQFISHYLDVKELDETDYLFWLPDKQKVMTRKMVWQRVAKLGEKVLGKHIHPHMFRHSLGVHLARMGVPISQIKDILGHSNIENTAIYLKFSSQEVKLSYKEAMRFID